MTPEGAIAHYRVTAKLGEGGMGAVYRATDTKLNREVAVKVLPASFAHDPDRLARFTREAQVLASLNHPNIAAIYGVEEGALILELVEGPTLADRVAQGAIPIEEALPIARQIAEALEYAHEKGIVHRDLKPENIKVTPEGRVKVLDFGLAKALTPDTPAADPANSPTLTMQGTAVGMIMGTAGYMSPEQARGKTVDRRADIWSFGVVLHEMLSGKALFQGETVADILAAMIHQEPNLDQVPASARRALRACLQKDVKLRLQSIGDWRLLLEESTAAPAGGSKRGRSGWVAAAMLAVIAVAASWLAWSAMRPKETASIRLDLDLGPDRTVRSGQGPDVILSPDGTRLAWLSHKSLFTRRLDQSVGTELAGTEGAFDPIFSPDGQWIAFAAGGRLKKIPVAGGAAVTLCDASNFSGSWGEDGDIVAALYTGAGLSRIPADGGAPAPLIQLDAGRRERAHRWPQILPGGKAVLFTSSTNTVGGYNDASIVVASLAGGQRKTLPFHGTFARYLATSSHSGHLIYMSRGTLFAVPFDPAALAVRGAPVQILEHVDYSAVTGAAKLDASRDGTLVYESGGSSSGLVTLQWLEEGGKTRPLLAKPGYYGRPRFSPDGRRLALEIIDGSNQDIWVEDLERDSLTRLTFDGKTNSGPIWTPDGRSIVFQDMNGLSWTPADGGGHPQQLLGTKSTTYAYSFPPDGKRLAYMQLGAINYELWTVPVEGGSTAMHAGQPEALLQTPFDARYPTISPDGRWLAYTSTESGVAEVYVRAFAGPNSGGAKWKVSSGGGAYPMWSRTGRQLFYEDFDTRVVAAAYTVTGDSFLAEKPRLWSEKPLAASVSVSKNIDLAPDGMRFAVVLPVEDPDSQTSKNHVTLIEGFFDELRRRAPEGNK